MTNLRDSYLYHRSIGFRAVDAFDRAHHDLVRGKVRYGRSRHAVAYNPQFAAYGERRLRWIENAADGLRFVGYADELARLDHTGWYLDDCCGDTVRGAVWQLPGRHGAPLYVPGYADPWNDGAACLSFDDLTDDKTTAALWADSIAERMAEAERDYQRAASAGFEFGELAEEIARRRRENSRLAARTQSGCRPGLRCRADHLPGLARAYRGQRQGNPASPRAAGRIARRVRPRAGIS